MSIRSKLLLTLLLAGLVCIAVTGATAYQSAKRSLTAAVANQLTGMRRSRANQIEAYFQKILSHVQVLDGDPASASAIQELTEKFDQLDRSPVTEALRASVDSYYREVFVPKLQKMSHRDVAAADYLPGSPVAYRLQDSYVVKDVSRPGRARTAPARFDLMFAEMAQAFGYEDILLIEPEGEYIVYSLRKDVDFGTSLLTGPYRHTGLARIVGQALASKESNPVFITDFEHFDSSFGAPAAFVAAPIVVSGRRLGVVAAQLSIRGLDNVVSGNRRWESDGLGKTGDAGIVGADYLIRSNTRKFLEDPEAELTALRARGVPEDSVARIRAYGTTALEREVRLPSVAAALAGKERTMIQNGASGYGSIVSYMPLTIPGLHWSFATRIDTAEALAPIAQMRNELLRWSLVLMGAMSLTALGLTRKIVNPLNRLAQAAHQFGAGRNTSPERPKGGDELGRLEKEFDLMIKSVTSDIEQRTAESQKLRSILDHSPVGVAISVGAGMQFVNPRFVELTGVRAGEPSPNFYRNPGDREAVMQRLKTEGIVRDLEVDSWGPKREPRTYLVTYSRTEFEGCEAVLGWISDVTPLKQFEEELKRVNLLSDSALELSQSGYWEIDFDDPDCYRSSERLRLILGEEPKKDLRYQLGDDWIARISAADKQLASETARKFREAIEGRYARYDATFPYKRPSDGRVIWCQALGTVVRRPDGRPRSMHGVVRDITEQRAAQQALAAEHARLKSILDTSPVGVGIATDGVVRFANPRVAELVGQKVGSSTADFYANLADREHLLERLKTEAVVRDYEMQATGPNGQVRDLLVTYIRTTFEGRDGVLGWLVDVTALKKIERELQQSERRLEAAALGANLGLWEVDPVKGEIFVNEILESQLGYEPLGLRESRDKWARLRGGLEAWPELLHPDDRERVTEAIRRHLAGESDIYRTEHRIRVPDGSFKWIFSAGNSVERDSAGHSLRANGVHIDISEMKALQAQLVEARDAAQQSYAQLRELEQLRDNLVHMIIHDMRSPLAVIMMRLEVMLENEQISLSAEAARNLQGTLLSVRNLASMTNDLLDVSRLESGKFPLSRGRCDLVSMAKEVAGELVRLDSLRKIDVESSGPVEINCDATIIRRVLVNLVSNGIKHTPAATPLRIKVAKDGRGARIEIRDKGPGVPPEFRKRIFEKFGTLEARHNRTHHSVGLGLAFCRLGVEAHGGAIGVDDGDGGGSVFWIQLPDSDADNSDK